MYGFNSDVKRCLVFLLYVSVSSSPLCQRSSKFSPPQQGSTYSYQQPVLLRNVPSAGVKLDEALRLAIFPRGAVV